MAEFQVAPQDLDGYGKLIERVGDQAESAKKYLDSYGELGGATGFFIRLVNLESRHSVWTAKQVLSHLEDLGYKSSKNLENTATHYRDTDKSIAARVDTTYPAGRRPTSHNIDLGIVPVQTSHFKEHENALGHLTKPESSELVESTSPLDNLTAAFERLSPSAAVMSFLQMVTGHNPTEEAGEWFGGDWKSYAECGGALENIGRMLNAVGNNVQEGANELGNTWRGNAADTAQVYFNGLASASTQQAVTFSELGEQYKKAATGIARLAETGAQLYNAMIDHCIIGAAATAAAAASSETGVGAVIGGGVAAVEAAQVIETYEKFSNIRETGTTICNTFIGAVQGWVSGTEGFRKFPLPGAPYESPMEKS